MKNSTAYNIRRYIVEHSTTQYIRDPEPPGNRSARAASDRKLAEFTIWEPFR
jgi:hypothetical protein